MAEKTFTEAEVKAMLAQLMSEQQGQLSEDTKKRIEMEKLIGPVGNWLRCHSCSILADKNRYDRVDWEEKAELVFHSSRIFLDKELTGKYFCRPCKKAQKMREGKQIKACLKRWEDAGKPYEGEDKKTGLDWTYVLRICEYRDPAEVKAMKERDVRRANGECIPEVVPILTKSEAGSNREKLG